MKWIKAKPQPSGSRAVVQTNQAPDGNPGLLIVISKRATMPSALRDLVTLTLVSLLTPALLADPATSQPATSTPATKPALPHVKLIINKPADGKAPDYTIDAKEIVQIELIETLRILKKDDPAGATRTVDIQFPADLPYKHLATTLVCCAQANIPKFRLSTDGKEFADFTMPAIDKKSDANPAALPADPSKDRIQIKLNTTDNKLTATINKEPLENPEELTKLLNNMDVKEKRQLIISPTAETKSADVLAYAKAAVTTKTNVAFSPVR